VKRVQSVSIIIPVYDEKDSLPQLLDELRQALNGLDAQWEIIFIDDGSRDGSLELLRRMSSSTPGVRYLSFQENRGKSAALAAGFQAARGDTIVTMDADLQADASDIPRMLDLFDSGWDVVAGYRRRRRDTIAKKYASKIANWLRNRVNRETIRDSACPLRVMNAEMALRIPMFTGMHRFLPTLMRMQGAKVTEIAVNHRPRLHGVSKYGIWDRAVAGSCDLLAVRWMQKRHCSFRIRETDQAQRPG
jgi:dolichol-phosphate mannosyltransferase